jgi:amino acid adenylation domain-containing protein/thioester reductase-like protein
MMNDVARRIGDLPPEKLELLMKRLVKRQVEHPQPRASTRISRLAREAGALPLSFAQRRLWFLEQLMPGTAIYNIPQALQLTGPLDVDALERAFNEIGRRHETLRTTFHVVDGQPMQVIADSVEWRMPIVDLSAAPVTERAAVVERLIAEEIQLPFDLTCGPLLRAKLLRLADAEHVLIVTMHHIISDGWSFGVATRELAALYEAFVANKPSPLPDLPIQYVDFAHWQQTWLQDGSGASGESPLQAQLAYWKQQLSGDLPMLDLPTDRSRPAFQSYRGAHHPLMLPGALTQALKALSGKEGVSLFTILLAALKTLLYRYSGQTDICVGSPVANRTRPEIEGLIGFFVNTLALRTDLSGNPPFRELLGRVREVALGAYARQDLPFEKLVEELQPERDLSRAPLFQVLCVQLDAQATTLQLAGLTLEPLPIHTGTAQFDLSFYLSESHEAVSGYIEYNTDLFEPVTIARMAGHFETLLNQIARDPDQLIADLPILTPAERRELLVEWNATQRDYPSQSCLQTLFEAQAARTPDEIAVIFEAQRLTYGELNRRANQLANYLRALSVGPDTLVGICVERSLEMMVGLLGVLKAGGAYVPLDPAFPTERLALMLEDSRIPVLLTQRSIGDELLASSAGIVPAGTQVISLDTDWQQITQERDTNPALLTTPDNLAYTIYTSGSTGRPKGVQIPHRAVVNFLHSMACAPGLNASDTLLAVTTLSFDIAGLELFLPLLNGARLIIAGREVASDGVRLKELLDGAGVTVMQATPATWRLLLAAGWQCTPRLKILCGGEALPRDLANQLLGDGGELWNMYGPTETTIWSATCRVTPGAGPISIGCPIDNTQIYLLDPRLQPVPIGAPGELYIGGDGLAHGYLNRPDLTAEKFVPDLFGRRPGARLYRTGDLMRYTNEGEIEFLSRIDHQVKVRGFRIELGDIETALSQSPAVGQAVVVVREDVPGDKRLVAYIVPSDRSLEIEHFDEDNLESSVGTDNSALIAQLPRELRAFLKSRLPDYMIPSSFVLLDAMPLTPNGKVNRRALPAPNHNAAQERAFVAPRTPLEATLAAVWGEVLRVERVSIDDNFFELGGHSLLATQLIFRAQSALQVTLPVRAFFEAPTVAGMAQAIEAQRQGDTPAVLQANVPNLADEAALDPTIRPDALQITAHAFEPQALFLTGATGFLGAFLLHDLLQQTRATIYCLVRASDVEQARARIQTTLATYQLWDDTLSDRIAPVIGDLAQPLLGLGEAQFQRLAEQVDVIYHSGAVTSFIYPYATLKAPNVLGTQEILRLACRATLKPVHFISTLSVFSPRDQAPDGAIREQDAPEQYEALATGYMQSKWVAERLALQARARGIPVCVYRPGRIAGHSRSGACQTDDFAWRMIKACIEAGSAPDLDMRVDMTPMDYVSQAIVYLSRQPEALHHTFHLLNTNPPHLNDVADWIRAFGYPLEQLAYEQWRAGLLEIAARSSDSAAAALIPFLSPQRADMELGDLRFDQRHTHERLESASIICPTIDQHIFATYLMYYIDTGFLEAPIVNKALA